MKKLKFLLSIMLLPMIAGCVKGGNSSVAPSSNPTSSNSFTSLSVTPVDEGCSISGSLIEISTGCFLETGESYNCALTPSSYSNKEIKIVISDETIFTTEFLNGSKNNFAIKTHKQGDAILKVYAAEDDYLLFRDVIRVRDPYSPTQIQNVVFDKYDIWNATGIYGNYTMSFFTMQPLSGLLYGKDDYENTTLNFSLEYVETKKIFDFRFHSFNVKVDAENSQTRRVYTELDIAVTGDNILFYYEEGLLEMFRPAELSKPAVRG